MTGLKPSLPLGFPMTTVEAFTAANTILQRHVLGLPENVMIDVDLATPPTQLDDPRGVAVHATIYLMDVAR